jgi:hypothetical protein
MIKMTNIRDAMKVSRNAVNVSRAKCRVGFGGKTAGRDMGNF